jgi:hypothetical protein
MLGNGENAPARTLSASWRVLVCALLSTLVYTGLKSTHRGDLWTHSVTDRTKGPAQPHDA